MNRFINALLFTPLISPLIFNILRNLIISGVPKFEATISILPAFYIFTLMGLLVFGIPSIFLLKSSNNLNLVNLTLTGGLTGFIYIIIFRFIMGSKVISVVLLSGVIMGAMTALIFGLIAGILLRSQHR